MRINEKTKKIAENNFLEVKYKLLNKKSAAETHFSNLLRNAGIYFIREKCNFKKNTLWCYYDFYIPKLRLYVEIDGEEHNYTENKKKDFEKEMYVKKSGRFIIRFTNKEVLSLSKITVNTLLDRLYLKVNRSKYYTNIRYNKKQIENNIINNFGNSIPTHEMHLYSHQTGMYYKFDNFLKCCYSTGIKPKMLMNLLQTKYEKSTLRLYVVGKTLSECEYNVSLVYE